MCDCIQQVEAQLKPHNTGLRLKIVLAVKTDQLRPEIGTYKLDSGKRGQPVALMAAFCPFCGHEYEQLPGEATEKEQ